MRILLWFQLSTWLSQIGQSMLARHSSMGSSLASAKDFLEVHEQLDEDIRVSASYTTQGFFWERLVERLKREVIITKMLHCSSVYTGNAYGLFYMRVYG